jgi:hypothetical protein
MNEDARPLQDRSAGPEPLPGGETTQPLPVMFPDDEPVVRHVPFTPAVPCTPDAAESTPPMGAKAEPPGAEAPVEIPRRPSTRVLAATGVVAVLAALGAFLALRDVASRLDGGDPVPGAVEEFDPGLASAFAPGPRLGDLRGLLEAAPGVAPAPATLEGEIAIPRESGAEGSASSDPSISGGQGANRVDSFSGSGNFGGSQSFNWDQRSGNGNPPPPPPSTGGGRRDADQICNMPAMC